MVSGGTGRGALLGDFAGFQTVLTRAMHDVLTADASGDTRFRQATGEAQRLLDNYDDHLRGRRPRGHIQIH
ncbi:hypothetical protein [Salinispora oceanensis]|uniref:hypothetical protein n=1 Tax=Salinispora oceanensis TaxID=1050199 RepID=UPI00035DBD56|nr:hypothetical protein [Salinispora oceanensis]